MKHDVLVELKALRLHGMAGAWADLIEQGGNTGIESSRWLIEHLLQAEGTDRSMRSVSHQMKAARFPVHRDLAGFDFEVSPVDRKLVTTLATTAFTDDAHKHAQQRRRAAYLMGYGICAWMLLVLWAILRQREVESSFILVYLLGTFLLAAWSTRQVLLDLKEDSAVVDAATQALRPRRVQLTSSTNKADRRTPD